MPVRQTSDGGYSAWVRLVGPSGDTVVRAEGESRPEAVQRVEALVAQTMVAHPDLRYPDIEDNPYAMERWDYAEPQKPALMVSTAIYNPDGRKSVRIMDYSDRDARRRFLRKMEATLRSGGWAEIRPA